MSFRHRTVVRHSTTAGFRISLTSLLRFQRRMLLLIIVLSLLRPMGGFSQIDGIPSRRVFVTIFDELESYSKNSWFVEQHQRPEDFQLMKASIESSRKNAMTLFETDRSYSKVFKVGLGYDLKAFQDYASAGRSKSRITARLISAVTNAAMDLELKTTVVSTCNTESVETTVNTTDVQGNAVPNCIVWYADVRDKETKEKFKFDKNSTPTTDQISAGKWMLWSEKAGRLGNKVPYDCGGKDCRTTRKIDIPAP